MLQERHPDVRRSPSCDCDGVKQTQDESFIQIVELNCFNCVQKFDICGIWFGTNYYIC